MQMAITWADIRDISIPLCPQTVMACELSAISTPWEPLRLCFQLEDQSKLMCSLLIPKSHLPLARFPVIIQQKVVVVGGCGRIRLFSRGVSGHEHFAR